MTAGADTTRCIDDSPAVHVAFRFRQRHFEPHRAEYLGATHVEPRYAVIAWSSAIDAHLTVAASILAEKDGISEVGLPVRGYTSIDAVSAKVLHLIASNDEAGSMLLSLCVPPVLVDGVRGSPSSIRFESVRVRADFVRAWAQEAPEVCGPGTAPILVLQGGPWPLQLTRQVITDLRRHHPDARLCPPYRDPLHDTGEMSDYLVTLELQVSDGSPYTATSMEALHELVLAAAVEKAQHLLDDSEASDPLLPCSVRVSSPIRGRSSDDTHDFPQIGAGRALVWEVATARSANEALRIAAAELLDPMHEGWEVLLPDQGLSFGGSGPAALASVRSRRGEPTVSTALGVKGPS